MKEQVPANELTPGRASSTLDKGRSLLNVLSPMDQGQNEQPPRANPTPGGENPRASGVNPAEFTGPQDSREMMRVLEQVASERGTPLTPEQKKIIEDQFSLAISGGETDGAIQENNPQSQSQGFNGGRFFSDIIGKANVVPPGEAGINLLNKLYEEAAAKKVNLPMDTPDRDALLAQMEQERAITMNAIRERFNAIKPTHDEREESESGVVERLKELINDAKGGDDRLSSLSDEKGKAIVDFIESVPFGGPDHLAVATYVAKQGQNDMSEAMRKLLFEQVWEKFVGRADKLPEEQHYRESLGGLQATDVFDKIKGLADTAFTELDPHTGEKTNHFALYLNELAHARQNMHDLNLSFRVGENYKKAVVEQLSAKGLHFVQNELVGVNRAVLLWEKYAAAKVAERHQWLSQGDIDNIEKNVKDTMVKMGEMGLLKDGDRDLTLWEINRASRMGKISFAGTQRLALYVGYGNIPHETQGRIGSIPYEYVARAILNFKTGPLRFFGDTAHITYMNKIFRMMTKDSKGKDNGKVLELFGADQRMIAANSLGAFDMESHGWRSQLIFLNNILMETGEEVDGKKKNQTFMEFINEKTKKFQKDGADIDFTGMHPVAAKKEKAFHDEIRDVVIGQRLYLSTLTRFGGLSEDMQQDIWRKIAMLKPSTIMSLLPKEMIISGADQTMLDNVRQKLYIAEMKRVQDDSKTWASISHGGHAPHVESKDQIKNEVEQFRAAVKKTDTAYRYQILTKADFTADEQAFVKKMIDRGIDQAKKLAGANFSHTLQIDDAPYIAWTKIGSGESGRGGMAAEDMVRILLSDQGAVSEAWGAIAGHVESPQKPPTEAFGKFIEGFGGVFGRGSAQQKIEPILLAFLEFAKATDEHIWLGALEQLKNEPGSELAGFYRESHIAMDEKQRSNFLRSLAGLNIISDNFEDAVSAGKMTQLDRLRDETDSDRWSLFLRSLRIFLQYLPVGILNLGKNTFTEPLKGL